jgi:hypothetical protein
MSRENESGQRLDPTSWILYSRVTSLRDQKPTVLNCPTTVQVTAKPID